MSMYTALSGITAAQADIATTAHNIANVATMGFKSSRAEFADIFSSSPLSVARTAVGSGVQMSRTQQSFTQGNVTATGNVLDLAIEGAGFFAIRTAVGNTTETQFTRAGAFTRDITGTIVNSGGSALLGWPVSQDGSALSNNPTDGMPIVVPPIFGEALATTEVELGVSLPTDLTNMGEQDAVPPTNAFDATDPETYAFSTSVTILSEDGEPQGVRAYYIKTDNPDALDDTTTWDVRFTVDGVEAPMASGGTMQFDSTGTIIGTPSATTSVLGTTITLDLSQSRLANRSFRVETASHNGVAPAQLYSLEIDASGTISASYSSGESVAIAKVFLANFANPQGLRQMGATAMSVSAQSGTPILGSPGETGFGLLRSGALERSNVELTQELVNLISAQRNYQASAKAMETSSSLSQTIINMRS